ncbi:MAG TPA: Na+/H+ antiporter NhaC family protein, partial [Planococcus sp. (in: firmicutes)]|nr:Na+/H+ antiporter NhaC family protein [Planococcus sp. (in: firmicutes)]
MFNIKAVLSPSIQEALALVVLIVGIISVSIIRFESVPHVPILFSILLLFVYGLLKGVSYKELEKGLMSGAGAGMGAVFLFFFIGILIGTWMLGGTIPTLIYTGFNIISVTLFFAIVFAVTAIIGISIGSSLTTVATIGVAFIGMAAALDLSLAITAGAIVSGAFFGDKMSPLSDTTNLASTIVGVDLFEHIRNMGWTTIPAFLISFVLFAVLSPTVDAAPNADIAAFQQGLMDTGMISWASLLPMVVLIVLAVLRVP